MGCSIEISRDIYMYVDLFVYDCLWETHTKKWYAKMHGRNYVVQTRECSEFETKCRFETIILPSSGRSKPTCDTRIIHKGAET